MSTEDIKIGPAVQVWANEPASGGMLENAVLRTLGGRAFIVGTLAPKGGDDDDPRVGVPFWFAFDEVVMFAEFPDLATAQRMYRTYNQARGDSANGAS